MDNKFETQSGGHLKEGHESSDLSVRGIVISGVLLVAGAIFSFVLIFGMIRVMENWERAHEAKLSPMEQQLQQERNPPKEGLGKVTPTHEGEIKPAPDWYERGKTEDYLVAPLQHRACNTMTSTISASSATQKTTGSAAPARTRQGTSIFRSIAPWTFFPSRVCRR